jgi:hypothetical protein
VSERAGDGALCENIGPRQRALRRRLAVGSFVVGDALSLALVLTHAAHPWRLTVFLPFLLAAICLLEAQHKTCVLLAARGTRDLDDGEQPVTDPAFLRRIALQARRVMLQAVAVALALTLALWLVP